MRMLSVTRLGFALGASTALLYLACMVITMTAPKPFVIHFFNSILHGVDVAPIMRWAMPWWEMVVGVLEVFILGWLFGALLAVLYNVGTRPGGDHHG
jgi:hypothetical protein